MKPFLFLVSGVMFGVSLGLWREYYPGAGWWITGTLVAVCLAGFVVHRVK